MQQKADHLDITRTYFMTSLFNFRWTMCDTMLSICLESDLVHGHWKVASALGLTIIQLQKSSCKCISWENHISNVTAKQSLQGMLELNTTFLGVSAEAAGTYLVSLLSSKIIQTLTAWLIALRHGLFNNTANRSPLRECTHRFVMESKDTTQLRKSGVREIH